jgi:hypothetical protein
MRAAHATYAAPPSAWSPMVPVPSRDSGIEPSAARALERHAEAHARLSVQTFAPKAKARRGVNSTGLKKPVLREQGAIPT